MVAAGSRGVVGLLRVGGVFGRFALASGCRATMLCKNPFARGVHLFPCGQCMPCRINRRRLWTHRIMLETLNHGSNTFVTLTYSDENLPQARSSKLLSGGTKPSLAPEDLRNWLKRLRKAIEPVRIRYYAVGEYGDAGERPHYHAALFGYQSCRNGNTLRFRGRPMAARCCASCRVVNETWGKGDVDLGSVETNSAQYLAGYTTKKLTRFDDPRLEGRHPEFARMSLRPGIGLNSLWEIADVMMSLGLDESEPDVPSGLRHGGRIWPLGRYLKTKLRTMIGKDGGVPDEVLQKIAEELLPLREAAKRSKENPSFKAQVLEHFKQDVLNLETRSRVFKKRGSL